MPLTRLTTITELAEGSYDHGDVHLASGRVVFAHTERDSIEIVDGDQSAAICTVEGCPEGSGVSCDQSRGIVVVASRARGELQFVNPLDCTITGTVPVGPAPNGLAIDSRRGHVLVADVTANQATLIGIVRHETLICVELPGRPRWVAYQGSRDRYLVNIKDPAVVVLLSGADLRTVGLWNVGAGGPHGLDLDHQHGTAFVACDEGVLVALDTESGDELYRIPLPGAPDVVWYNPVNAELYVAVGEPGVITVIDTSSRSVTTEVQTEQGAHTFAVDLQRQRLYLPRPKSHGLEVFSTAAR